MDITMPETTDAPESEFAPEVAVAGTEPGASSESALGDALTIGPGELTRRLDRINLTQALLDFEIANARVLDLTSRVVDSNKRVLKLQAEADASRLALEGARADIAELLRRIGEVEQSTTYRAAQKLGSLRRLFRFLRN